MEVGLFFGTFNPVHVGHLIIANYMLQHTSLNEVWFVVSPHNPFKEKKSLLKDYHRLALVDIAIENHAGLISSNIEFDLPQPSYTTNTLAHLTEKFPTKKFSLIMGEDNLDSLHKWKNAEQLVNNYPILVYPRLNSTERERNIPAWIFEQGTINLMKDLPIMNLSSTFIRNEIKVGNNISFLVPEKVAQYIDEMNFYK
ncbi:MAG: nicotinate-nucleotide adenylyltransferase [Flavobacteriales bacterium]|jgi:nicotinate-nucleotide adenylyltransferase